MAAYLLYFRETSRVEATASYMKRFAWLHDMDVVVIDRKGDMPGSAKRFATIADAIADPDLSELTWIFLDACGETYLDEYEHPADDVVYCIGSDFDGFDGTPHDELPGTLLKLRQVPEHTGEWFASIVAPLVVYDRFLYLQGRRK